MKRHKYPLWERMHFPPQMTEGQRRLYQFCAHVRNDEPLDAKLLDELVICFEKIIWDREKPGAALGLSTRGAPKKPDPQRFWRRIEIAAAVINVKRKNPRQTIRRIADSLVESYGEKASYIEDCYEKHKKEGKIALLPKSEAIIEFLKLGHTLISLTPPKSPRN